MSTKGGFGADYIPQADLASTIGFAQIADAMPTFEDLSEFDECIGRDNRSKSACSLMLSEAI